MKKRPLCIRGMAEYLPRLEQAVEVTARRTGIVRALTKKDTKRLVARLVERLNDEIGNVRIVRRRYVRAGNSAMMAVNVCDTVAELHRLTRAGVLHVFAEKRRAPWIRLGPV